MTDVHGATLALAKALLSRRSITPDDGGCLEVIEARLTRLGFVCEDVDRAGVRNLWATHGHGAPLVSIAGHVDVVPPGPLDSWTTDPFTPTERGEYLYARGAIDMKGPFAAALTAVERLVAEHPDHPGTVAVLATSDEEGAATDGTVAVIERLRDRGDRIDYAIVAEATSNERLGDTIKHGRRGSLNGTVTIKGVQCHIAYPQLGRNPIHLAAPAIAELASTEWDRGNDHFQPTSFQISNIHAGTGANNVVPGLLTLLFNVRYSPASSVEQLQARVVEVLARHGLEFTIEWSVSARPFLTAGGTLVDTLTDVIRATTGVTPELSTSGGTSDARFIAAIAREVVEFGPPNATMHAVDERICLADLAPLSRIYEQAVSRLLRR